MNKTSLALDPRLFVATIKIFSSWWWDPAYASGITSVKGIKDMELYKNLGGDSGIEAFELGEGSIKVRFKDQAVYLYSNSSAGAVNIDHMKKLARQGHGLNSFINTSVREKYEAKLN